MTEEELIVQENETSGDGASASAHFFTIEIFDVKSVRLTTSMSEAI